MPELAEPGLRPDTPVCAEAVATAREGVGTAISAARAIVAGARFSYALCRPPGHHAGPGWLGGYCYLNNAAAAAQALHDGGFEQVAILDLDLHYPNGTSALLERMTGTTLHSLHGSTGANLPWERVRPRSDREHLVAFRSAPAAETYLVALARSTHTLAQSADAIVLSLGYDLVEGDPHGSWSFGAPVFERIGRLLARTGLPICVVQEGGYALESLAECSHAFATGLLDGAVA
jgi:acetoin utilization deacetylase AcuC-like enzyme